MQSFTVSLTAFPTDFQSVERVWHHGAIQQAREDPPTDDRQGEAGPSEAALSRAKRNGGVLSHISPATLYCLPTLAKTLAKFVEEETAYDLELSNCKNDIDIWIVGLDEA